MRSPLTFDQFTQLAERASTPEGALAGAATLLAWAEAPHPDDDVSPRELIAMAGNLRGAGGDAEGGVELLQRALSTEGEAWADPRGDLHHLLVAAGRDEEAQAVAEELRREKPTPAQALRDVATTLWDRGRLTEAHRWYTLAASRVLREAEDGSTPPGMDALPGLLADRAEIRVELDLPTDELDELGSQIDLDGEDDLDADDLL
ncbi:hypothetical protein [uncultured Pseudokineococcus sp.]|uniref:hypothetical protein n=1 Tax=uncultured Pseudokineococcus sp. TaxID=1642928 RepID=UPI002602E522|nr:hypothetical protein [uncultured Pseudokineococcus sp.]